MMPTSRITVLMRKALERTRVTISRVATRATACAGVEIRRSGCRRGDRHAALGSGLLGWTHVAEELGQRRQLAGELAYRTGRQRRPQHRLVVDAIGEPERGAGPAAAEHAHPGSPSAQPCRGVRGVDHQATTGLPARSSVDRAAGHHAAAAHDADPVADALDEVELMAGEDDGNAGVAALAQHLAHHVDGDRVESGERLVEHQQLRLVQQRGGQLHALLVAEAELLDLVVAPGRDPEPLGPARRRRAGRRPRSCRAAGRGT